MGESETLNKFNWREYLILNPDIARKTNYGFTERGAIKHYNKYGKNEKRKICLDSSHPFKNINLFNYMIMNKGVPINLSNYDEVIMYYCYNQHVEFIKEKPYVFIFSNSLNLNLISDCINIIINSDFILHVSNSNTSEWRKSKLSDKKNFIKNLHLMKPEFIVIDIYNIESFNINDIEEIIEILKVPYIITCSGSSNEKIKKMISNALTFVSFDKTSIITKGNGLFESKTMTKIPYTKDELDLIKKNMRFNIVGNGRYFAEYVDLLKNYGFTDEPFIEGDGVINIKLHFPFKEGGYVVNTEKIVNQGWIDTLINIKKNNKFIDFCKANSPITGNEILFLPCVYHENVIWKYIKTKEYDVGFVGTLSIRRKKILDALIEKGIKVNIIKAFGEERDIELSKCKLIINLNFNENHKIFQYFRCSRIVFNKIPIVSEKMIDCDELDINKEVLKFVTFEEYDKIIDKIVKILENYDSYVEKLYKDFSYAKFGELSEKHICEFKQKILS